MLYPKRNILIIDGIEDPDTWYGTDLIRPESTKGRCDQGVVRAVGPLVKDIKVGDYVIFSPYAGKVMNVEGEGDKLIFLPEEAIDCVVENVISKLQGLFFQDEQGNYFPADYVSVMRVLTAQWNREGRVIESKRKWNGVFG